MREKRLLIKKGDRCDWTSQSMLEVLQAVRESAAKRDTQVVVKGKARSLDQNAALFGVAYSRMSNASGIEVNELHRECCKRYFGITQKTIMGRLVDVPIRTTTVDANGQRDVISRYDMANFFSFVQQIAAEDLGVIVPDPDKNWKRRMREQPTDLGSEAPF